jgi:hypothetical protein
MRSRRVYDAVLLGVKAYSLDAAIDDFAAAVGPETTIIPALNGMRHLDIPEERFGEEPVAGGVCKVAATIDPEGRVVSSRHFRNRPTASGTARCHGGSRSSTLSCKAPGSRLGCRVRSSTRCGRNGGCSLLRWYYLPDAPVGRPAPTDRPAAAG